MELHWTTQSSYPILALLQLLPLLGIIWVWLLRKSALLLPGAITIALFEFILAIELYLLFDQTQPVFQFAEQFQIAGPLYYHTAVDGMAVLFILLTALLTGIVVIYGRVRVLLPLDRLLMICFATTTVMMSMFVTVDLLWFALQSLLQAALVGYLLWFWSTSPERDLAIRRYSQFMGSGLLLLFIGIVFLGWQHATSHQGQWRFDLFSLSELSIEQPMQNWIFFLLFYGLGVRIPLFPLHGWLPLAIQHGSVAIAPIFLLGLKTGIYGLLRFVMPLFHDAVIEWHRYVVAFAVVGIFYAALLAMQQTKLRSMFAYAVVSHTSILLIGLFSLSSIAFQGGIILAINFGLAISVLFLMTGLVYRRTHTTTLAKLGNLFDRIPIIAIGFFIGGVAIVGMPGTPGFDAVHLVLEASIERYGAVVTTAAAVGNVLAAGFLLLAFQRAFLAPQQAGAKPLDVEPTLMIEKLISGFLILIVLGIGFYSEPWMALVEQSANTLSLPYRSLTNGH